MAIKHNNVVPNVHFRKWWQRYVKTWFNQAGRKKSRRVHRIQKAAKMFPRPVGTLRPTVRPATVRYNFRTKVGRGFTLAELKAAKIPRNQARTIGISVDHRRHNHCEESLKENTDRLMEYKNKLMIFPRKSKVKKGDTARSAAKDVRQIKAKHVLPVKKLQKKEAPRAITDEEKATSVYRILRKARSEKRMYGKKIKKEMEKSTKKD
jgi:large subunit ribosomal protein L13e